MTSYSVQESDLHKLKGKTILITGASTGIGRATAKIAHEHGANIAIGDWNGKEGANLLRELGTKERVLFRKVDVSNWDNVLDLFEETSKTFGVIDAVLSNAGVNTESLLNEEFDSSGRLLPPDLGSININLIAHLYVVKCAVHYFSKWPETRHQIVLTGSAASFIDTPPLHLYCAAKAGVLGFMRSLRTQLAKQDITVNMIAPWMTITPMLLDEFMNIWGTLPANQPWGVAHAILLPVVQPEINGKAFFVAGHEIVEFEDKLHETQPLWMGKELSSNVDEGQRRLIP